MATRGQPLTVTAWIPGKPLNPKNVSGMGLWKHRRMIREARELAQRAYLFAMTAWPLRRWPWPASTPKAIHFHAQLRNLLDDDSLPYALSAYRDAAGDMGLIGKTPGTVRGSGRVLDGPDDGHAFTYSQARVATRADCGVRVTITAKPSREES